MHEFVQDVAQGGVALTRETARERVAQLLRAHGGAPMWYAASLTQTSALSGSWFSTLRQAIAANDSKSESDDDGALLAALMLHVPGYARSLLPHQLVALLLPKLKDEDMRKLSAPPERAKIEDADTDSDLDSDSNTDDDIIRAFCFFTLCSCLYIFHCVHCPWVMQALRFVKQQA